MSAGSGAGPIASAERPARREGRLLFGMVCLLTTCFLLLSVRLFFIQVLAHDTHLEKSRRGISRTDPIPAYPGDLRTRDGVILARSHAAYDLGIDVRPLDEPTLRLAISALSGALGHAPETRRSAVALALRSKEGGGAYARLARGVKPEVRDAADRALAGAIGEALADRVLVADRMSRRAYPRGEFLAQVVGATDVDGAGLEGIERTQAAYLRPRAGKRRVLTDAREELRFFFPENVEVAPVHGYDVHLTVDSRAQRILEEELLLGIQKHDAEAGHAVLMDCKSGDVLALASWPRYDPNHYHDYPREELLRRRTNRAIESVFEPGSVIKPFIAAMALELGLFRRDEFLWEGGRSHRVGGRRLEDVSDHGPLDLEGAVVHSSNIAMSLIGMRLGRDGLIEALTRFGFCRRTGIELPFEAEGSHTPASAWNDPYSTVSVSFGYEVMVSPIQLATAFAALVNGGYLLKPRIVDRYAGGSEVEPAGPVVAGRPIREETSRAMREILYRVVEEGTGKYLKMDGFAFGGKTGTADMDPRYTKKDYLASFEGFAPYEDPRVVCLVMLEKPRSGKYYGGTVAGPVVARTFRRYFRVVARPKFEELGLEGW